MDHRELDIVLEGVSWVLKYRQDGHCVNPAQPPTCSVGARL
jgi:hypothetical protein